MKKIVMIIFIIEIIIPAIIGIVFFSSRDRLILPGYSRRIIKYQDLGRDKFEIYEYPYSKKDNKKFIENKYYKTISTKDVETVKEYVRRIQCYGSDNIENKINEGDMFYLKSKYEKGKELYDDFSVYFFDKETSTLLYLNYVT